MHWILSYSQPFARALLDLGLQVGSRPLLFPYLRLLCPTLSLRALQWPLHAAQL